MLESTSVILRAYGAADCARPWARRSLAAATISMALKICCMLRVERMRRRRSFSDAMRPFLRLELRLERLAGFVQALLVFVAHRLGGADVVDHLAVLLLHECQPLGFEAPHHRDRQIVQIAVGPRPDRDHLL